MEKNIMEERVSGNLLKNVVVEMKVIVILIVGRR